MARLNCIRPHMADDLAEATERMRKVLEQMEPTMTQYVDKVDWSPGGTTAKIVGRHIEGFIEVDEKNIVIDLKLSLAAALVKGKIVSRIDQALEEHMYK